MIVDQYSVVCINCTYYDNLHCYFNPPVVVDGVSVRAGTAPMDKCGEFKAKQMADLAEMWKGLKEKNDAQENIRLEKIRMKYNKE